MDIYQFYGMIAMFVGMGVVIGYMIKWLIDNVMTPRKWPIDIVIVEKRGKETFHIIDKARALKDMKEGVVYYRLKKGKRNIKPIEYGFMCHGEGGRGLVHLYSPNRDEYFVTRFETESMMDSDVRAQIKVVPDDNKFWWITSKKFDLARWAPIIKGLEKALPIIMVCMIIAAGTVMIVLVGQNMQQQMSVTAGLVGQMTAQQTKIIGLLANIAGQPVPKDVGPPDTVAPTNSSGYILPGIPNPIP